MDYVLLKDHDYLKIKSEKKAMCIDKDKLDVAYTLIDQSTPLKGPVYTIINKYPSMSENDICSVDITISRTDRDVPFDHFTFTTARVAVSGYHEKYSIQPIVEELGSIDSYKEEFLFRDDTVTIHEMIFHRINSDKVIVDEDDIKYRLFKKLGINTCMHKVESCDIILYKNGTWGLSNAPIDEIQKNRKKIKKIFLNINDRFFYMITPDIIDMILSINDFHINIFMGDSFNNSSKSDFLINYMTIYDIYDFLDTCFYLPSVVELERIYNGNFLNVEFLLDGRVFTHTTFKNDQIFNMYAIVLDNIRKTLFFGE